MLRRGTCALPRAAGLPAAAWQTSSTPCGSPSALPCSPCAAKMWDSKVAAANKAWDEQVKAVTDSAEAALDAGISKVSQVVRRCGVGWGAHRCACR